MGESGVDVIVAVHGPSEDLGRCLASVRAYTDLSRHRLVVVADGPLHPEPARLVAALCSGAPGGVLVLESPVRRGYVASANAGLAASARDAVLLNSDTEVAEGWLEGLRDAALSAPDAGTVTPFSSNATLCSLPFPFSDNRLPAGHTVASFARLVAAVSARRRPALPTGVGFCLYVRRAALDAAGPLDEERFGLGYGEEVDLCERLRARGFRHLLDDATYVWHRGGGSFGADGGPRARRAARLVSRLHPGFLGRVARFMSEDPLRPERERVVAALHPSGAIPARGPRVLHAAPGWPDAADGSTGGQVRELALAQALESQPAVYAPGGEGAGQDLLDGGVRVRLGGSGRDREALGRFLDAVDPALLHLHQPAAWAEPLLRLARRRGIPLLVHLHEARGRRADGAGPLSRLLEVLASRRSCRGDAYLAASPAVARSWLDAGPLPGAAQVEVLPPAGPRGEGTASLARRIGAVYARLLGGAAPG